MAKNCGGKVKRKKTMPIPMPGMTPEDRHTNALDKLVRKRSKRR